MGQQRVKEDLTEAEAKEQKKKQEKPKAGKPTGKPSSGEKPRKKLKGKDWYVILAPKMFGETPLAETPTVDPKSLIGRTVESTASELLGQPDKYYMNMKFKINKIVDDNKAITQFHGYSCAKEHLFRIIRKRSQKVRAISNIETKDGWRLQVVSLVILNRNTDVEIRRKVRKIMVSGIAENASRADIDTLIRSITSGILQKDIRKLGNKVYPVRFSEVESIEVIKAGPLNENGKAVESTKAGPLDADVKADVSTKAGQTSTDSEKGAGE
jgi:ribosomal protein S3AE